MTEPSFSVKNRDELLKMSFMTVYGVQVETPDGSIVDRELIDRIEAVVVVPLFANGDTLLERQYRPALDAWLYELPAGRLDVDGEAPDVAALRELREETGHDAKTIEALFSMHISPGWTNEYMRVYLATELIETEREHDSAEEAHMEVIRVGFSDALAMIQRGEITDAKTISSLLYVAQFVNR